MSPTLPPLTITSLSSLLGSISIAFWILVFAPQIITTYRLRSSAGLSIPFIIIWLAGDVFNIAGAVMQGVRVTMVVLAVWYTVADVVLLGECLWFRREEKRKDGKDHNDDEEGEEDTEETPLLAERATSSTSNTAAVVVDATHLSPATPFIPPSEQPTAIPPAATANETSKKPQTALRAFLFNTLAILLVILAGTLGWYLTSQPNYTTPQQSPLSPPLQFDLPGQILGYLSAILYLGSRFPQLILNYRRKSTEGVSLLFFLFAVLGNLTYVLSIFAYEPGCGGRVEGAAVVGGTVVDAGRGEGGCRGGEWGDEYGRYILVNTSWLIGSAGTLVLDLVIFGQFWAYRDRSSGGIGPTA